MGCAQAMDELGVGILLTGDKARLEAAARERGLEEKLARMEVLPCGQVLSMEDEPTSVIKDKADSSMAVGLRALAERRGDAFASAGNSGALVVGATTLVKRLEPLGVDGFIAEGTESGGHVGELTTMALVPQVADSVTIPVIAAGGIACARQLRAAFALGAVGVQVGTCLLVAEECPIHQNYKEAILRAKDTDTVVTGRIGGTPVRVLKNRMAREYVKRERAGADKMELETFTLGGLRRAVLEGDTENGSLMAGQVAGMCGAIRPVAEILAELAGGVPPLSCHAAGDHPKGAR